MLDEDTAPVAEGAENGPDGPAEALSAQDGSPERGQAQDGGKGERRDARTRAKLRDVEAERDRLRAALVPHLRAAVESAVGDRLDAPQSLWLLPDLDPLELVDGGTFEVDRARVDEAVGKLLERAPQLGRRFHGSGDGGARAMAGPSDNNGWAKFLNTPPAG